MTVFGMAAGEFQFMDSSVYGHWMDRDCTPVSNRNYAHEIFAYSEDLEETPANILDELDDYFRGPWHIEKGNDAPDGGYHYNYAVADDTETYWPFIVRRRVALFQKEYNMYSGWEETPYSVPDRDIVEAAEGYQPRKVFQDCD
jgi:hypothetical protein